MATKRFPPLVGGIQPASVVGEDEPDDEPDDDEDDDEAASTAAEIKTFNLGYIPHIHWRRDGKPCGPIG